MNLTSDQRNWWGFFHLSPLLGYLLPLANLWAPLLIWFLKKSDLDALREKGLSYVFFQLKLFLIPVLWLFFWLLFFLAYIASLVIDLASGQDLGLLEIFRRISELLLDSGRQDLLLGRWVEVLSAPTFKIILAGILVGVSLMAWPAFHFVYCIYKSVQAMGGKVFDRYFFEGVSGTLLFALLVLGPHIIAAWVLWSALTNSLFLPASPPEYHL
jgi:uncharacterized Tic20 family protein